MGVPFSNRVEEGHFRSGYRDSNCTDLLGCNVSVTDWVSPEAGRASDFIFQIPVDAVLAAPRFSSLAARAKKHKTLDARS